MRSTTLFGIYGVIIIGLVGGFAGLTLYSLEKSRWWDARTQLAQESYGLHLHLEANVFRLFKQQGDSLLIGNRDSGVRERELKAAIEQNLVDIRNVIAREIQMVGEEEIEELELLEEIDADIRAVNAAIATLTASGDPIENFVQIERLAALLDGEIDVKFDRKIKSALAEELEEVNEVLAEAAAFRAWYEKLVYIMLIAAILTLFAALVSFNVQIRQPIIRLQRRIDQLRRADYSKKSSLGGSKEFRDLGAVLSSMGEGLAAREVSRIEQQKYLEDTVAARTTELQQLIAKLEKGEENRKQLMADISHELRTPLAIILGEADVTLRTSETLNADVSDSFARIRESAKHTNQIVADMLTVARYEAGQLRLDRQKADLRKVVHDAVAMYPETVQIVSSGKPMFGHIDEVRVRQSVLALLQNARRYGGPTVSVTLKDTAEAQLIIVEDNGPGLSREEMSQAFERFFRGSNASGQGVEGSGLGLPVVKSIVQAHGGTVDLQNGKVGGLMVTLTLPKPPILKGVPEEHSRKSA